MWLNAISNLIKGGLILYGLMAVAISITMSAQPITGGSSEYLSRLYSTAAWPALVWQARDVLGGGE